MVLSKLYSKSSQNLFNYLIRRSMASSHGKHEPNPQLWQKLFFLICIPAIGLSAVNTYLIEKEHHEHYHRPEFKTYEYMRFRTKPFPWGDGQRSLFHNPKYNALPDGWEELPEEEHKKH